MCGPFCTIVLLSQDVIKIFEKFICIYPSSKQCGYLDLGDKWLSPVPLPPFKFFFFSSGLNPAGHQGQEEGHQEVLGWYLCQREDHCGGARSWINVHVLRWPIKVPSFPINQSFRFLIYLYPISVSLLEWITCLRFNWCNPNWINWCEMCPSSTNLTDSNWLTD